MEFTYKTSGTCSREIAFEIENGTVKNVQFFGGCNGNLKGIGALVEGIRCGSKVTSCPDQLAQALKAAKNM